MPDTAQSKIEEVIDQFSVSETAQNIYGVLGQTLRGEINDPSVIITSWPQFKARFGGFVPGNEFPYLCYRALQRGASLRVNNVKHYTNITDASTIDAVLAVMATTDEIELDSALVDGQTMNITVNNNNFSQAFTTSSFRTLQLIADKIVKGIPAIVESAVAISDTLIVIIPKTTVTLTTTSVPSGVDAPSATISNVNTISDGTDELFRLKPKAKGSDYNNLIVTISPSLSGAPLAFDIVIRHAEDGTTEEYRNLIIPGKPTVADSHFLDAIKKNSNLVVPEYLNLSAATANTLMPLQTVLRFKSGTNGSAVVANDYIGNSTAKNGFHAFDAFDDMIAISPLAVSDPAVHFGGMVYAETRKDLEYHGHLTNTAKTEDALIAERDAIGYNSSYARFFAGGTLVIDPISGADAGVSEMGDVAGIIAYSMNKYGNWYSPSGKRRGLLTDAKGVVNNFGANNNIAGLNRLANKQINTVITRDGVTMLWGNFTASIENNSLKWANIRSLLIYMKKAIKPLCDLYLEEPNDIPTWRDLYRDVKPFLEELKDKRAVSSYDWQGDQFAESLNDLKINNQADVAEGKYLVKLFIQPINSLQLIEVQITLDNSSVSFEDRLAQNNNL